ncbi:hypothetical protein EYC84_002036 [Monilinia fructicola]|uniref:Transmembrane protein n=1 Tax=Monilinia fructicola TaxID=38448 RepID=A0A5M9JZJ7_MONFR|nr:hypothetical protein EYC84_002036 [Monilinia fructicola]
MIKPNTQLRNKSDFRFTLQSPMTTSGADTNTNTKQRLSTLPLFPVSFQVFPLSVLIAILFYSLPSIPSFSFHSSLLERVSNTGFSTLEGRQESTKGIRDQGTPTPRHQKEQLPILP